MLEVEFGYALLQIPANCLAFTISRIKHPGCLFWASFLSIDQDAEVFVCWQWSNSVFDVTLKKYMVYKVTIHHQYIWIQLGGLQESCGYMYMIYYTFNFYICIFTCMLYVRQSI